MSLQSVPWTTDKLRAYLQQPAVRARLQGQFQSIQGQLTTSIGQATRILGISEFQARSWEEQGILSPSRSATHVAASKYPGQRRYSVDDLFKMAVAQELSQEFSLAEIAVLLKRDSGVLEEILGHRPPRYTRYLGEYARYANDVSFWRFFLPRTLHLSLCLLTGTLPQADSGICLPIEDGDNPAQRLASPLENAHELPALGKSLVGWQVPGQPFCVVVDYAPTPRYPERLELGQVDQADQALPKTGAYWLVRQDIAARFRNTTPKPSEKFARAVAQRLLALAQQQAAQWLPSIQDNGNPITYYSPAFRDGALGDQMLTQLAERIVALGGESEHPGRAGKPRWKFCAILLPYDPLVPLPQQSLVVQAQSSDSPYQVGKTTISPASPIPLSLHAFQSSQIVSLKHISPDDPYLYGLNQQEREIYSAIAVPIEREHGQAAGVIYIASEEEAAFSREEDMLLLRLLGRVAGELLLSYRARSMLVDGLAEVVTSPQIVDPFFALFEGENAFVEQLEAWLGEVQALGSTRPPKAPGASSQPEEPLHSLTLAAFDIEDLTGHAYDIGEQGIRNLVRAVGRKLQRLMALYFRKKAGQEVWLYRLYLDRFYLLIKNMEPDEVEPVLCQLYLDVNQDYHIDAARISDEQSIPSRPKKKPIEVTTRLVGIGYTRHDLESMFNHAQGSARPNLALDSVRAKLTIALDEGLMQTKNQEEKKCAFRKPGELNFTFLSREEVEQRARGRLSPPTKTTNGMHSNQNGGPTSAPQHQDSSAPFVPPDGSQNNPSATR